MARATIDPATGRARINLDAADDGRRRRRPDTLAAEEPLEIRVGRPGRRSRRWR